MGAQGYIGRAPGDSSVIVARQTFTPTGITTNFTFASGYTVGYVDAYLNGARLIEGEDYTATDGSVVGLTTHAQNGDVLELVVYKAFNVANVTAATADFSVGGDLSVTGNTELTGTLTVGGVEVQPGAAGTCASYDSNTGISTTKKVKIENNLEVTGAASTFSGNLTVGGQLTYDDVTNVDSIGFVTARSGLIVQGAGSTTTTLNVTGVSTFSEDILIGTGATVGFGSTAFFRDDAKAIFGDGDDLRIYHDGSNSYIDENGIGDLILRGAADIKFMHPSSGETYAIFNANGASELYYDNDLHFATTSDGCKTNGDLSFRGDGDVEQILFDASDASLKFTDSKKAKFGTDDDLEIYHDGTHSYIKNNTSELKIGSNDLRLQNNAGTANYLRGIAGGAAILYHNNSEKFTTTSGGIEVTGNIYAPTGIGTAIQWDATSDITLKENIEVINEPITKLSQLKGVTFDWKFGGHSVGVIAQDVEKVLPTAVGGSKDQKTVNYNAIIGLLVESVKDQQKQIEELKSLLDK